MTKADDDISTDQIVRKHIATCEILVRSYETSIRSAEQMLDVVKDPARRRYYQRKLRGYRTKSHKAAKLLIIWQAAL